MELSGSKAPKFLFIFQETESFYISGKANPKRS